MSNTPPALTLTGGKYCTKSGNISGKMRQKKGQPPAADRGLLGKREAAWKRRQTQPGKRKKKKAVVSCAGYAADEDTLKV